MELAWYNHSKHIPGALPTSAKPQVLWKMLPIKPPEGGKIWQMDYF